MSDNGKVDKIKGTVKETAGDVTDDKKLEATKAIRRSSHELAKTIPIIAMTANAFSEDIQHSLAAGMNAHVSKPVEMKVLEKTIRSIKSGGGHRNAAH